MKTARKDALAEAARKMCTDGVSEKSSDWFRNFLRDFARDVLVAVMHEEVEWLCGPRHRPSPGSTHFRSGSTDGYALYEGRRMDVVRPRVRLRQGNGRSHEAPLATYLAAQKPEELHQRVLDLFRTGVSGRDQKRLHGENTPGVSASSVSRLWRREGEKALAAFRGRDIARNDWVVLMLDGLVLARDLTAVVALGVAGDGTKHLLDFEIGASENTETAKGLVERLVRRGFRPMAGGRLLAVLDGSAALRSAVVAYWPPTVVQRCLVHKERNVRRFLRQGDWAELGRLFGRLRQAQGLAAGQEALRAMERFVGNRNKAALESLREPGDEMLAWHRLEVPATLNTSFLSTNLIENPIRNMRRKMERVCRWNEATG